MTIVSLLRNCWLGVDAVRIVEWAELQRKEADASSHHVIYHCQRRCEMRDAIRLAVQLPFDIADNLVDALLVGGTLGAGSFILAALLFVLQPLLVVACVILAIYKMSVWSISCLGGSLACLVLCITMLEHIRVVAIPDWFEYDDASENFMKGIAGTLIAGASVLTSLLFLGRDEPIWLLGTVVPGLWGFGLLLAALPETVLWEVVSGPVGNRRVSKGKDDGEDELPLSDELPDTRRSREIGLVREDEEQTEPKVGMRYNEVVRILGQGYNHTQFGDRDFYLFKGLAEHDYTIAFQRGTAVDIREFRKDPNQIYGA